jgi:hypothetical protein
MIMGMFPRELSEISETPGHISQIPSSDKLRVLCQFVVILGDIRKDRIDGSLCWSTTISILFLALRAN